MPTCAPANAYLRSYVERMQEEADGYCHGDRRWTAINSFDPRLWPPSRPQPDETILMADDLGLIAMARARYEDLSDQEKMLDLSHLWAEAGDLRPAGVALAAAGRGADDRLVHVATGEMVVPQALLANDPWLRSYIVRVFKAKGLDWRTYVVGGPNRINPATGLAEFDPYGDVDERTGFDNDHRDPTRSDVDERTGFDVDHRDPTGGGAFQSSSFEDGYEDAAGSNAARAFGTQSAAFRSTVKSNSARTQKIADRIGELQRVVDDLSAIRKLGRYDERDFGHMPDAWGMRNSSFGANTPSNPSASNDYAFTPNDLPSSADYPNKQEYLGGGIRVPGAPGRGSENSSVNRFVHNRERWFDKRGTYDEMQNILRPIGPSDQHWSVD